MATETQGKVVTCRAVLCRGPKIPLTIEEVSIDPPKVGEVRVKVVASGVCHSDVHLFAGHFEGSSFPQKFPTLLGHEGSGVVESVGDGVTSVQVGDHVLVSFSGKCNDCYLCANSDKTNICMKDAICQITMPDGTVRTRTSSGEEVYNFSGVGTFAEYLVCREGRVAKIRKDAPLEKACILSCGIPTGYGTAVNIAKIRPGSTVAIWGLGTIGLATVSGARDCGATKIIGVDRNPDKFNLAAKFGCTDFVNPKQLPDGCTSVVDAVKKLTGGIGVDYAIECAGFHQTFQDAYDSSADAWGMTVLVGLINDSKPLEISPNGIAGGKVITGGFQGGYHGRNDLPKLVDLYMEGRLLVDELITGTVKLEQINDAFEWLLAGKALRTVVMCQE
ncbi:Alcohol dehydrogenase class-3 [Halotydeus destructor]|nr:Alcohol dehydrogenase class-3 [Halotydeus destructor]